MVVTEVIEVVAMTGVPVEGVKTVVLVEEEEMIGDLEAEEIEMIVVETEVGLEGEMIVDPEEEELVVVVVLLEEELVVDPVAVEVGRVVLLGTEMLEVVEVETEVAGQADGETRAKSVEVGFQITMTNKIQTFSKWVIPLQEIEEALDKIMVLRWEAAAMLGKIILLHF